MVVSKELRQCWNTYMHIFLYSEGSSTHYTLTHSHSNTKIVNKITFYTEYLFHTVTKLLYNLRTLIYTHKFISFAYIWITFSGIFQFVGNLACTIYYPKSRNCKKYRMHVKNCTLAEIMFCVYCAVQCSPSIACQFFHFMD